MINFLLPARRELFCPDGFRLKKYAVMLARQSPRCYNVFMDSIIKKKKKLSWIDWLAIGLIGLVLTVAIVMLARYALSRSLGVIEAEYQSFTNSAEAEALVIRGEHLITAPAAGYFKPYYEEGSKVAAGSPIGVMAEAPDGEGTSQVNCGAYSGMVSYQLDGWEDILNAEALDSTDRAALIKLYTDGAVDANAEDTIDSTASGRVVAKIIDNFQGSHVLLWLDQPPHPFVSEGSVSFTYAIEEETSDPIAAQVEENGMLEDGRYYLLLNVPSTVNEMLKLRHLECTLLGETISGVSLPEEAVVTDDSGQTGVWTISGRRVVFCPINITGQSDGNYFTDDIENHTLVVTSPAKARQGMRYYG